MEQWYSQSIKVTKLRSDREKARALMKMTELREKRVTVTPSAEFATLLVEEYYEMIKELVTAIMSIDGWKTTSHEMLVGYLAEFYKEFTSAEITLVDQLRMIRNDIGYRGVMVDGEYVQRNQETITKVIKKLKQVLDQKLL